MGRYFRAGTDDKNIAGMRSLARADRALRLHEMAFVLAMAQEHAIIAALANETVRR